MAYDEETADRVRRLLAHREDVAEKRMVGGLSFNVGGAMCCGVTATGLMIRVGPDALEATLEEPNVGEVRFGGRRLSGFVEVDPAGYLTDAELREWIARALAFVATLPSNR
jgi:TfoX N-terminal domain